LEKKLSGTGLMIGPKISNQKEPHSRTGGAVTLKEPGGTKETSRLEKKKRRAGGTIEQLLGATRHLRDWNKERGKKQEGKNCRRALEGGRALRLIEKKAPLKRQLFRLTEEGEHGGLNPLGWGKEDLGRLIKGQQTWGGGSKGYRWVWS